MRDLKAEFLDKVWRPVRILRRRGFELSWNWLAWLQHLLVGKGWQRGRQPMDIMTLHFHQAILEVMRSPLRLRKKMKSEQKSVTFVAISLEQREVGDLSSWRTLPKKCSRCPGLCSLDKRKLLITLSQVNHLDVYQWFIWCLWNIFQTVIHCAFAGWIRASRSKAV